MWLSSRDVLGVAYHSARTESLGGINQWVWKCLNRPTGVRRYSVNLEGKRCIPERPRSPEKSTSLKVKHIGDYELMETAACLPFCTAIRGLAWRQVYMLRFPSSQELVRSTSTATLEAPGSDTADS